MLQWITSLSFLLGICVAHSGILPCGTLFIALGFGIVLLLLQFWTRKYAWLVLVWNVFFAGALWYAVRTMGTAEPGTPHSPTFIERVSASASTYAHDCLLKSGLGEEEVSIFNAMLLGNRKSLSHEQKMRFRGAGVQHLLALSGLHLGIFLGAFSFLFLRRARFSRHRWPILFCVLLLLWGYCLIAGMPQSLLRAMLMTTLFYFSLFSTYENHASINLANTLLIMLLIDPASAFDIGTQLSFAAVGSIIWVYPILSGILPDPVFSPLGTVGKPLRYVYRLFMVSVATWLGTLPLCLYYFHQMQPWQPLNSVVLIPLTTLLLYAGVILLLLCMMGIWLLAVPFAKVVMLLMGVENVFLDVAGRLPFSTMQGGEFHLGHVFLLYVIVFIMSVSMHATRRVQITALFAILFTFLVLYLI